jgi:hypothetical protein
VSACATATVTAMRESPPPTYQAFSIR